MNLMQKGALLMAFGMMAGCATAPGGAAKSAEHDPFLLATGDVSVAVNYIRDHEGVHFLALPRTKTTLVIGTTPDIEVRASGARDEAGNAVPVVVKKHLYFVEEVPTAGLSKAMQQKIRTAGQGEPVLIFRSDMTGGPAAAGENGEALLLRDSFAGVECTLFPQPPESYAFAKPGSFCRTFNPG